VVILSEAKNPKDLIAGAGSGGPSGKNYVGEVEESSLRQWVVRASHGFFLPFAEGRSEGRIGFGGKKVVNGSG